MNLITLICGSTILILISKMFTISTKKRQILNQILQTNSLSKRAKLYLSYFEKTLIFFFTGVVGLVSINLFDNEISWTIVYLTCWANFIAINIAFISVESKVQHHTVERSNLLLIIGLTILLITVCSYTIVLTRSEVSYVQNGKATYGTTIYLDDSTKLVSDSTNYYIGKTQNFLFFYHEKAKTTDVYPMDRVKQLTFKDNGK